MARFNTAFYSATAIAADTAICSIVPAATVACKIRRFKIGVMVVGGGAPSSVQVVLGLNRGTARGTATTTLALSKMDPRSAPSQITGVDTVWSTPPTIGASSTDCEKFTMNSQSGYDVPWEFMEELWTDIGTANPLVLVNRDNALPANHRYTITPETEE